MLARPTLPRGQRMKRAVAGPLFDSLPGRVKRLAFRTAYLGFETWVRVWHPVTIGVRVLLIEHGTVLLVRHTYRDGWFLPGGGVKRRETLEQAARREAHEEVGAARLGTLRLLGVHSNFGEHKSDHVVAFVCTDFIYTGDHDEEIAQVQAFPLDSLPANLSPGTARRVAEYLRGEFGVTGRW
jgi:ADP-ribose pyrophosphatase YjhB (NUDIX family)